MFFLKISNEKEAATACAVADSLTFKICLAGGLNRSLTLTPVLHA